jgi:hypothetical protein
MLGPSQDIRCTLMTFGLPVDAFPSIAHDEEDNSSLDNHIDWFSRREKLEDSLDDTSEKDEVIGEPGPFDVVMGRGYEVQIHPGNICCY